MTDKTVVVLSGGLDSTTLLYDVRARGYEALAISFAYGQKHAKELDAAISITKQLGVTHKIVTLDFKDLFANSGSSLVTNESVPEGHYGEESMKATIVPNRNMIMFSIACGYAISEDAQAVAMGMHAGDHFIYPDCRPEFVVAAEYAAQEASRGDNFFEFMNFMTPFISVDKNWIALHAFELGVPIEETWSCYKGNKKHCGKCGTCVERLEALDSVKATYPDFEDPTEYADKNFWREALERDTV